MAAKPAWHPDTDPEAGGVLVFWALAIVVLLGMVALSFDLGRIAATQSELQSYADNLAIAAAAELDRKDDSIDRAIAAAATLIRDSQTFGEGPQLLTAADYSLIFYQRGPGQAVEANRITPDTSVPGTISYTATEQAAARYVRAVVTPREVRTPFTAVLGLISGSPVTAADVTAEAAAGLDEYACKITPMFFCVPPGWTAEANPGQMIRLRSGGQGTAWGPGNFGFLDPSRLVELGLEIGDPCLGANGKPLTGENLDACLIAAERPTESCFLQDGVDLEPGQKVGRNASAFNVVFDIYHSTMNGEKTNADYRPAPNVIKGIKPNGGNSCIAKNYVASQARSLPRDGCLDAGTCAISRFGDGTWDDAAYVAQNHAADPRLNHGLSGDLAGTRYEMYRAEVLAAGAGNRLTKDGLNETGRPSCANSASPDINRRVFIAAAINCGAPNNISGAKDNVPVEEYVRVFLTEPVGYASGEFQDTNDFDIHIEVLGNAEEDEGAAGPAYVRKVVRLIE